MSNHFYVIHLCWRTCYLHHQPCIRKQWERYRSVYIQTTGKQCARVPDRSWRLFHLVFLSEFCLGGPAGTWRGVKVNRNPWLIHCAMSFSKTRQKPRGTNNTSPQPTWSVTWTKMAAEIVLEIKLVVQRRNNGTFDALFLFNCTHFQAKNWNISLLIEKLLTNCYNYKGPQINFFWPTLGLNVTDILHNARIHVFLDVWESRKRKDILVKHNEEYLH